MHFSKSKSHAYPIVRNSPTEGNMFSPIVELGPENRTRTMGSDELLPSSIRTQKMIKLVTRRTLLLMLGFIFLFGLAYNSWLKSSKTKYKTIMTLRPHDAVVHHANVQAPHQELTCRRWRADKSQNSNVREEKSDKQNKAWHLSFSESMDYGWLGWHNIDRLKYKYGSATADERVDDAGFCRVMMATVPRSGSTWFRQVLEKVTGLRTCSVYSERHKNRGNSTFLPSRKCWVSVESCGASAIAMQGGVNRTDIPTGCRKTRIPIGDDPILVKSHLPFQSIWRDSNVQLSTICAVILIVRNPIDVYIAERNYSASNALPFKEYITQWAAHNTYWLNEVKDLPIIVTRYEDFLMRPAQTLEKILSQLPGKWGWSLHLINEAYKQFPSPGLEAKCGQYASVFEYKDVNIVHQNFRGIMDKFGYSLRLEPLDEE
eukprot:36979_1